MLLQRGKFLVDKIDDIDINEKIIDLSYMGRFEFEGNAIPISRMFMEYYRDEYVFYPIQIFDIKGNQMYIFANSDIFDKQIQKNPNYLSFLAEKKIDENMSLWDYVKYGPDKSRYNFWWSIDGDYFIFFGEKYKTIVQCFIDSCYTHDGEKEGIKRKLLKAGYEIKD